MCVPRLVKWRDCCFVTVALLSPAHSPFLFLPFCLPFSPKDPSPLQTFHLLSTPTGASKGTHASPQPQYYHNLEDTTLSYPKGGS